MVATSLVTAEELALLPDDGFRYELIRGELIRMSPPNYFHGRRVLRIGSYFLDYADKVGGHATSDSGYVLRVQPDTVLGPDVAYVRADRTPSESEEHQFGHLSPDVVVEIASPSDRPGHLQRKVAAYREAGVHLILIAEPTKRLVRVYHGDGTVLELHDDDIFDGGNVMPGFQLAIREFFR